VAALKVGSVLEAADSSFERFSGTSSYFFFCLSSLYLFVMAWPSGVLSWAARPCSMWISCG
jgi:hypothetical protein